MAVDGTRPCLLGCAVRTKLGWGVVVEDSPPQAHLQVALDWRLRNGKRVPAAIRRSDVLTHSFCALGQCVETDFGHGVLIAFRQTDGCHVVRLWRPWHSAPCTLHCQASALRRTLPGGLGFPVVTPYGAGTVCGVGGPGQPYFVDLGWGLAYLRQDCISCPAGAALPFVALVGHFATNKYEEYLNCNHIQQTSAPEEFDDLYRRLREITGFQCEGLYRGHLPSDASTTTGASDFDYQAINLLVVEGCKRLQVLLRDEQDCSASGRASLSERNDLELEMGLKRLMTEIGFSHQRDMTRLLRLAKRDRMLAMTLRGLVNQTQSISDFKQGMDQTCVGQVFTRGAERITHQVDGIKSQGTEHIDRLKLRAQGVAQRLIQEECVCAKATHVLTETWQHIDAQLMRSGPALAAYMGHAPTKFLSSSSQHFEQLLHYLKMLDLRGLRLELPRALRVDDLHVLLQQQATRVVEASGIDLRLAGVELLDCFNAHCRRPQWKALVMHNFDNTEVASRTASILEKGEELMSRMGTLLKSKVVAGIIEHFEEEDLEGKLVKGISNFAPEMFIQDLDRAMVSSDARESFLNQLVDTCLDGMLNIMPSVRIPEVSGVHQHTAYRVLDLNMSGVRFKKQDFNITVHDVPTTLRRISRDQGEAELVRVEAHGISADFQNLQCKIKPPVLPEASVVTKAHAEGITLHISLMVCSAQRSHAQRLHVRQLCVGMDRLDLKLDGSAYARLFNPLVSYLNKSLKKHICACLEQQLHEPVQTLCSSLSSLLLEAGQLLHLVGSCPIDKE